MNLIRREGAEVHTASAAFTIGTMQVAPATTSSAWISRTAPSSRRCSACSSTRRRIRGPYDDTGWAIPLVRNLKTLARRGQVDLRQADDAGDGRLQDCGRHHRHGPRRDRRSHDRQHARHVPLPARGREDGGGGEGVRGRRSHVQRRARSSSRTPIARRSNRQSRSSACRRGPSTRRRACRCTTSTCRESATSTPGRARRMKDGSGWRSTTSRCRTPTSARRSCAKAISKSKYDVIIFPHAGQGGSGLITGGVQGNEPRPYKKTDATPNVGTVDSTDDMRGCIGVEGLMELYKFVAGRRRAHHRRGDLDGVSRVQPHARASRLRRRTTSMCAGRC